MSAILFKHGRLMKVRRYYLGPQAKHTGYKADLTGIILALYLLIGLTAQITGKALIGLDNQAMIQSLTNQSMKPSHYLLNHIHSAAEKLQQKQDQLQNADFGKAKCIGRLMVARNKGILNLQIQWVPGHKDFKLNTLADKHMKRAARGDNSQGNMQPKMLRKTLPASISTIWQDLKSSIHKRWLHHWKASPRYESLTRQHLLTNG